MSQMRILSEVDRIENQKQKGQHDEGHQEHGSEGLKYGRSSCVQASPCIALLLEEQNMA